MHKRELSAKNDFRPSIGTIAPGIIVRDYFYNVLIMKLASWSICLFHAYSVKPVLGPNCMILNIKKGSNTARSLQTPLNLKKNCDMLLLQSQHRLSHINFSAKLCRYNLLYHHKTLYHIFHFKR